MSTQIRKDSLGVHSLSSLETEIVIDLGCCTYQLGNFVEDSIQTLIRRFKPGVLFGFDPHPALKETVGQVYGTTVITSRRAAWTHNVGVGLTINSNCTHVGSEDPELRQPSVRRCRSFDLAAWIKTLPETTMVLKMDIEGAEYVLLPYLIEQGLIDRFSRILVEWHEGKFANGYESERTSILEDIPCPVEEWQ